MLRRGADHSKKDVEAVPTSEKDADAATLGVFQATAAKAKTAINAFIFMDVAATQGQHLENVHAHAVKYDVRTEYLYSFLQVCTAALASFAHGSNDVANAAGPLSAITQLYENGNLSSFKDKAKVSTPIWILALMGFAIDCGLVLYGYNIMRVLGKIY